MRVLVSGSDGRLGAVAVDELRRHGHAATPADRQRTQAWNTQIVDFTDLGQVIGIMQGQEAVLHLAAIPSPAAHTADVVFGNNVISTFNVLEAAAILGIKRVALASSVSALGYAYRHRDFNPRYLPIDEAHPLLSQDSYGLSKMVGETLADGFARRCPDMSLISLRFTTILHEDSREWVRQSREKPTRDEELYGAFWTFVDGRDAASACRLALEYGAPGHEAFYINAPTIYHSEPVEALMAKHFPGDYPIAAQIRGDASPVDAGKAGRLLGWEARYGWDGVLLS